MLTKTFAATAGCESDSPTKSTHRRRPVLSRSQPALSPSSPASPREPQSAQVGIERAAASRSAGLASRRIQRDFEPRAAAEGLTIGKRPLARGDLALAPQEAAARAPHFQRRGRPPETNLHYRSRARSIAPGLRSPPPRVVANLDQ